MNLQEACNKQLISAAITNDLKKVKNLLSPFYFIQRGFGPRADVNYASEPDGMTALMFAARKGYYKIVKYLQRHKANVNQPDTNGGATPLIEAAHFGRLEILKYLHNHNADINAVTKFGNSALMHAVFEERTSCAQYLIKNGADVNIQNENGSTALIFAAHKNNVLLIDALVQNGADVNKQDIEGKSALMWSAKNGMTSMVYYLVNHGADIYAKTKEGKTALDFAINENHRPIIEWLRERMGEKVDDYTKIIESINASELIELPEKNPDLFKEINKLGQLLLIFNQLTYAKQTIFFKKILKHILPEDMPTIKKKIMETRQQERK